VPDAAGTITDLPEGALPPVFSPTSDMQQSKRKDETEKEVKVSSEHMQKKTRKKNRKGKYKN